MKLLLDRKYVPITSEMVFLKCQAKQAMEFHLGEARAPAH